MTYGKLFTSNNIDSTAVIIKSGDWNYPSLYQNVISIDSFRDGCDYGHVTMKGSRCGFVYHPLDFVIVGKEVELIGCATPLPLKRIP